MQSIDVILEGVQPDEIASLKALASGVRPEAMRGVEPLAAKGWVELVGGVPLITLTGRTLLDYPPGQLR